MHRGGTWVPRRGPCTSPRLLVGCPVSCVLSPCCCWEPRCCSGAGDGREAAGIISGVNRRHWGIVLWAISAFHTVPFSTASTAQPTPKGLHRGEGGERNWAFPLVMGVGRGEEPLALRLSCCAVLGVSSSLTCCSCTQRIE